MTTAVTGQAAMLALPKKSTRPGKALAETKVSLALQVEKETMREEGLLVYKVNKSGKLEARRLAVSLDRRTLWITTNKTSTIKGGIMRILRGSKKGENGGPGQTDNQGDNILDVEVSRMDHVVHGQLSKRFLHAKLQSQQIPQQLLSSASDDAGSVTSKANSLVALEGTSLTLYYRTLAKDRPASSVAGELETLDLVVPNERDYKGLKTTLRDLISGYHTARRTLDRTSLLLEYLWTDMGKQLHQNMSCGEWLELCDRLNVPLKRGLCSSLYKALYKTLRKELQMQDQENANPTSSGSVTSSMSVTSLGGGMPLWAIADLLNDLRFHSLKASGLTKVHQDPMLKLWYDIMGTDPVPSVKMTSSPQSYELNVDHSNPEKTISSVAFLSFVRSQQKEFKTTLEDAVEQIRQTNGQVSAKQLVDPNFEEPSFMDSEQAKDDDAPPQSRNDRMTKTMFFQSLLSDSNDLFNPSHGKVGSDDMTHPLSHYWICTSHDTYWNLWENNRGRRKRGTKKKMDEQMYLAALYRGVRCLELDVWDSFTNNEGETSEPVICQAQPKSENDQFLAVPLVLKIVRQFLKANPKCFPVILNIENHCSYATQERLAHHLFEILGNSGLIVVPDDTDSVDEADLLPSPHSMRGKVLVMGKRPRVLEDGAKVINDDFDDENDQFDNDELPNSRSREEEEELDTGVVIGFDAAGPIKAGKKHEGDIVQHTAGELLFMANQDLEKAKLNAAQAELKALNVGEEAEKAEKEADRLISKAGLTNDAVSELASQVKGVDLDPKEHVALLQRAEGEGVEVQEFFADAVDAARIHYTEADQVAIEAASVATASLQKLNSATLKVRDAERSLEESYRREREVVSEYQRAATTARAQREDADYAVRRVEKVRALLKECEESATSAESVVVTAMSEAKISEKRASETEARAARASGKANEDRRRADDETRREEELERQAAYVHDQLSSVTNKVKAIRSTIDRDAEALDRINEQLKLIEQSSQYARERLQHSGGLSEEKKEATPATAGKLIFKHSAKLQERQQHSEAIKRASAEFAQAEQQRRQLQDAFETKAHAWKAQSEVAAKARKASDRTSHAAEDLAEHAEEEREAANLRLVAREKAKSNVSEKDAYRASLKAQLAEAERASKEAEKRANASSRAADSLEHVNEDLPDHAKNVHLLDRRREARDIALEDYMGKKQIKEDAEEKAEEAKRLFDTSENVYRQAMRNARKDAKKADVQRSADRTAIVAFNEARLIRKQAEHALEDARYAQSVVLENQVIIKRATEYGEKMERITEIPMSLAKMTFLHTAKHRYWDKSFDLPNTHVHSFAQGVLDEMKARDAENHDRLKEFSTDHICRTFPSWKDLKNADELNSEPLFLWALGCQLVALNYSTFDDHLVKADGRFRRNGSSGYVLKPQSLTHDDPFPERKVTWTLNLLCGSCLPSPEESKTSQINPFVRVTVHGGAIDQKSAEHQSKVVMKNGFNPIWDEKDGFVFTAKNPSLSICVFSVFHKGETGEEFIASAAMPVSCMREGIRSVALFDKRHSRAGQFGFAALLVKATKVVG